jgi:hypothetical protein
MFSIIISFLLQLWIDAYSKHAIAIPEFHGSILIERGKKFFWSIETIPLLPEKPQTGIYHTY